METHSNKLDQKKLCVECNKKEKSILSCLKKIMPILKLKDKRSFFDIFDGDLIDATDA